MKEAFLNKFKAAGKKDSIASRLYGTESAAWYLNNVA